MGNTIRQCACCKSHKAESDFNNKDERFVYKSKTIICNDCVDKSRELLTKHHFTGNYKMRLKEHNKEYNGYVSKSLTKFRDKKYRQGLKCELCDYKYKNWNELFTHGSVSSDHQLHFCWECKKGIELENIESSYKYRTDLESMTNLSNWGIGIRGTIKNSFKRRKIGLLGLEINAILKCSDIVFIHHIESQFTEGMNWENHGLKGWHFDHIEPISRAKDYNDMLRLNHYTNFQPLWAKDNIRKSNKF